MGIIGCRDKLRVAHGASPGPGHGFRRNIAPLQNLERSEQLLTPELGATTIIGERRESLGHPVVAHESAIAGFQPPDRNQHFLVHAIAVLKTAKQCSIGAEFLLTVRDSCVGYGRCQIVPHRPHKLRLIIVRIDHFRVRAHAPHRSVKDGARNSCCQRFLAEVSQPACKSLVYKARWWVRDGRGSGRRRHN